MNGVLRAVLRATLLTTLSVLLTGVPAAWADPAEPAVDPGIPEVGVAAPVPAAGGPGPAPVAVASEVANPAAQACELFDAALNLAALNYDEFAYATAGNGNTVNYADPVVARSNVLGRTALREAAAAALSASRTPGLPPEISDPMQDWSLHATKLVLIMGLHRGGDSLNSAATQLNVDATNAQMACAAGRRS